MSLSGDPYLHSTILLRLQNPKVQVRHHLEETREQHNKLIQSISDFGGKQIRDKSRLPLPIPSKSIENFCKKHMTDADAELRGTREDAIVKRAEIVLRDTLIQIAQKTAKEVGGDAIPVLTQILDEERAMMDWINANANSYQTTLAKYCSFCCRQEAARLGGEGEIAFAE